jgi:hypothetical protein
LGESDHVGKAIRSRIEIENKIVHYEFELKENEAGETREWASTKEYKKGYLKWGKAVMDEKICVWLEKGLKKYGNCGGQDRGEGWQNYIPPRYKLNKRGVVDSHVEERDLNENCKRELIAELFAEGRRCSSEQQRAERRLGQLQLGKRRKELRRKEKERRLLKMWQPRHPDGDRRAYWCPILKEWVQEARIVFFHDLEDDVADCVFGKDFREDKFTTANSMVVSKAAKGCRSPGSCSGRGRRS